MNRPTPHHENAHDLAGHKGVTNHHQHTTPLLVDLVDAAALLGVSPSTIERMTRAGELPSIKLRGARRWSVATLRAWVADREGGEA